MRLLLPNASKDKEYFIKDVLNLIKQSFPKEYNKTIKVTNYLIDESLIAAEYISKIIVFK